MPATNLLTKALKLNYSIHLKIDGYPEAKFPITIGTIPLKTPSAPEEDRQEGIGGKSYYFSTRLLDKPFLDRCITGL